MDQKMWKREREYEVKITNAIDPIPINNDVIGNKICGHVVNTRRKISQNFTVDLLRFSSKFYICFYRLEKYSKTTSLPYPWYSNHIYWFTFIYMYK